MKKIILTVICCALIAATVSCDMSYHINSEDVLTEQYMKKYNDDTGTDEKNPQLALTQSTEISQTDDVNFEKYIGTWYDDFIPPNDLEIIYKDTEKIECHLGIYRLTTFHLILTAKDKEFSYVDKYNLISGKIDFKDNSVLVTIEESNTEHIQCGANYLFTVKAEPNTK